ncbi:MAG: UbiA family prenyltransferase, partial [Salinisphaeraceae bacterium]|nr:UbiA family prenyltransferase [Salinisphaeraceae bacterium]
IREHLSFYEADALAKLVGKAALDRGIGIEHDAAGRLVRASRDVPREALWLFAVLCLASFFLVLLLNPLTIWLSIPAVFLAASYPFAKRFTHFPQAHLGAAFGWAVPMAFAALTNHVPALAWLLYAFVLLWALIYDTFYAMCDRPDDLKIGVKSTAVLFGDKDRLITGILQVLMLAGLAWVGHEAGLGFVYGLALFVAAGIFLYQQWLIRHREPQACFQAFLNNHWFGAVVFAGILFDYLLR